MLTGLRAITVVTVAAAWLAFAVSFFLPAIEALPIFRAGEGPVLNGWDAFVETFWKAPIVAFFAGDSALLLLLYSPLVNVLLLVTPLVALAAPRHSVAFGAVLFVCGVGIGIVAYRLDVTLYWGFYVWVASFFTMSMGCMSATLCCILHDARERRELIGRTKDRGNRGCRP
jgi:hypothetical protein